MKNLKFFALIFLIVFFFQESILKSEESNKLINQENLCTDEKGVELTKYIFLSDIKNLELDIKNYRNWFKNQFRIIVHRNANIPTKYKKKFKGHLIVNLLDGTSCKLNATVRVHGDVKDHIRMIDGKIYSSLNIRLNKGNIESIIKFILLLPETRNGDNEIFTSVLLNEIGFISPRTKYLNLKFNGQTNKFIFQEKITKELLENQNLTEGPIIEASQRFVWPNSEQEFFDTRFAQGRMVNEAWALKNEETLKLSLIALSKFNQIISQDESLFDLNKLNYENKNFKEINFAYDTILTSMNAFHGLGPRDRKFYFDPINLAFIPVYYDGNSNIVDENPDYKLDSNDVNIFAYQGADLSLKLIQELNLDQFMIKLNKSGLKIRKERVNNLINKILANINQIKEFQIKNRKPKLEETYFTKLNQEAKDKRLVFYEQNPLDDINSFIVCEFDLSNCKKETLKDKEIFKLISGKLKKDSNDYIFISNSILDYKKGKLNNDIVNLKNNFKNFQIENTSVLVSKNISPIIDYEKKIIKLAQQNSDDIVMFKSGILEDWEINFIGVKKKPNLNYNFYYNGCLIFYKLELKNIRINTTNTQCEDGVNFIDSFGKIENIRIDNSSSDGIDMDFSNLEVKNINVNNANNDCLDVSYGNYTFYSSNLENCGDKGLSIGEKSKVNLDTIKIKNSNYGLVVKDSSTANIKTIKINNSKVCLSAYNKKQMFYGGYAKIDDLKCDNYYLKTQIDQISTIKIE